MWDYGQNIIRASRIFSSQTLCSARWGTGNCVTQDFYRRRLPVNGILPRRGSFVQAPAVEDGLEFIKIGLTGLKLAAWLPFDFAEKLGQFVVV